MPVPAEDRKVGARVSYEDVANPRKIGTVVETLPSAWGTQYGVHWDDAADGVLDYSDLRQAGWRLEPTPTADTATLVLADVAQARRSLDYWTSPATRAVIEDLVQAGELRYSRDGAALWVEVAD